MRNPLLFVYLGYPLASKSEGMPLTKRLVVFAIGESIAYTMFYYALFGSGLYLYYLGGSYIQDGTYFYH
jgi:hypothetical protein